MTLDEARLVLGVGGDASQTEVREAFRRRAREVHPDRHPHLDAADRERYAAEFHRVLTARDVLLRTETADAATVSDASPTPAWAAPTSGAARKPPTHTTSPDPPRQAPRTTLRFEEFVKAQDAEGFGPGLRSRRPVDVARIVVWSGLGVVILGLVGYGAFLTVMNL